MATTRPPRPGASSTDSQPRSAPRLGMVMRFTPSAGSAAVKQMKASGFQIASSSDFRNARAVPNDFDGADVQYFERFGIAIVRSQADRLRPMLKSAMESKMVAAARPERSYRLLSRLVRDALAEQALLDVPRLSADYLAGYREGVNRLVDHMIGAGRPGASRTAAALDEQAATWGLQMTNVVPSTLSGRGIKVAVLDTGFDDTHPDFLGRVITKKLFASESSESDVHGHGTHCVGTACGPLRPASGPRYGVAYESEIYAGKVMGDDGFGTDRSIIAGMDWAVEQGCHVISMSIGAVTSLGDLPVDDYEQIGQVCLDSGTLVVAAAGNGSTRPGRISPVESPANASTIMAIGALDRQLRIAEFSCGGLNPGQEVDLAAPGVDVLSSLPGGGYDRWDGTSMATPHVAGIAALLAESDPKFRGWTLWARLLQLAKPLDLPARDAGKGLVQAPLR